jgi:cytochrome o ubiquinol oxidase subunit 1
MWLVASLVFIAIAVLVIGHTFNYKRDYFIPSVEVVQAEAQRTTLINSGLNNKGMTNSYA